MGREEWFEKALVAMGMPRSAVRFERSFSDCENHQVFLYIDDEAMDEYVIHTLASMWSARHNALSLQIHFMGDRRWRIQSDPDTWSEIVLCGSEEAMVYHASLQDYDGLLQRLNLFLSAWDMALTPEAALHVNLTENSKFVLCNEIPQIMKFLNLSYNDFRQHGFRTAVDAFDFLAKSTCFDPDRLLTVAVADPFIEKWIQHLSAGTGASSSSSSSPISPTFNLLEDALDTFGMREAYLEVKQTLDTAAHNLPSPLQAMETEGNEGNEQRRPRPTFDSMIGKLSKKKRRKVKSRPRQ